MSNISDLLWETLRVYQDHGGLKRSMRNRVTGEVCLVGALHEAALSLRLIEDVEVAAERLALKAQDLFPKPHTPWCRATNFNDHYATTKEMVEAVIEKTAIWSSEMVV